MYFLKHENVLHAEYVKTAGSAGEGVVVRPDRKVLQDYLKNEKFFEKATADAIKKIDKSVRISTKIFVNVYERGRFLTKHFFYRQHLLYQLQLREGLKENWSLIPRGKS